MTRIVLRLVGTLAGLAALLLTPAAAVSALDDAAEEQLEKLRVENLRLDVPGWRASNDFSLRWGLDVPAELAAQVSISTYYRVLTRGGSELIARTATSTWTSTSHFKILHPVTLLPVEPGKYIAEVWFEASWSEGTQRHSSEGSHAEVMLELDDRRPPAATPFVGPEWIRGDVEPVLRIGHPADPPPLSGIRGYAVSIRPDSAGPPCAGPDSCTAAETDLDGGVDDDTLPLGPLPEGLHVISVVTVSGSGMRSAAEAVAIRVDATRPDLALHGSGGGWSNQPVRVVAKATDPLSGMAASGAAGPRTTLAVDGGTPTVAQGDEAAAIVAGSGVHSVAASARDAAGNARGEDSASPPLTGVVRIDEAPPSVSFVRSGDPAEPELIEALVSDGLSGPDPARGAIAVRPSGSGQPFEPLPTTVSAGRLSAHWDSDSFPRGAYEFRATGYDAAGNPQSSVLRLGGAPMVLSNPVKATTAIHFGFGGRRLVWHRCVRAGQSRRCHREVIEPYDSRPATRVVPYGRGLQVGGSLVSASGAPLAGFPVDLVESFDGGATTRTRTTRVLTDAAGVFLGQLARGPSRRVEARFPGSRLLTRTASRSLRLGVQSAVRLRTSTARATIGGAPVVFSGRIGHLDATIPSFGRPIQFQFRLPGSPWSEFRTVQTDAEGRFRYPYAFSDDDSRGVRFLFRAYAPPQPGWPYEPAVSRPVAVTGY